MTMSDNGGDENNDVNNTAEATSSSTVDHRTALGSTAYSFFLNIVVLDHVPTGPSGRSRTGSTDDDEGETAPAATTETKTSSVPPEQQQIVVKNNMENKTLSLLDKSLQSTMKSLSITSKAMGKTSLGLSHKATSFMSRKAQEYVSAKTMVPRAWSAMNKCIPELAAAVGLEEGNRMRIGKRFQQGQVSVLQVDLKADLQLYLAKVYGDEAAEQYATCLSSLQALGATDTVGSLEEELLPKVRQGLMETLSEKLLKLMKEKDSQLEIECIALDDKDQARWLFTFMEFQNQMMKNK